MFIICEFGVGGGSYAMRQDIPSILENSWSKLADVDKNGVQRKFACCGWFNSTDHPGSECWANSTNSNNSSSPAESMELYMREVLAINNSTTPCENYMVSFFQQQLYAVGTIGIVFATLQLIALISSIIVFAFIKVEQRRSQDERF